MSKNLRLHLVALFVFIGVFFILGGIDKSKLEKASLRYKPQLLFAHEKRLIEDGGSVIWQSFIYNAFESRRMVVTQPAKGTKEKVTVRAGFQGVSWSWKLWNLLWILLIVSVSFVYQLRKVSASREIR